MNATEKNCQWHFGKAPQWTEGPNSALAQHFTGEKYYVLMREAIQNSLDAVLDPDKPVTVSITMGSVNKRSYPNFFELRNHIQGCVDLHQAAAERFAKMLDCFGQDLTDRLGYIKIADSNTTGMLYERGEVYTPFHAFAFSSGVNLKANENSGGSFGFGKMAYFNVSPISTIFVSSRNSTNGQPAFIGISYLCTHLLNGEHLVPVGYYGHVAQVDGKKEAMPVTVTEEIPKRFAPADEPGTAVYIMGVNLEGEDREKAYDRMTRAVLQNYWLAVWEGRLVVQIDKTVIDREHLKELLVRYFKEDDSGARNKTYNPRPNFDAVRMCGKNEACLRFADTLPGVGEVELYVRKNPEAKDKVTYMRRNLMHIFSKVQQSNYGYDALFVCRGQEGDSVLKDIENPKHDEWDPSNRQTKTSAQGTRGREVLKAIDDFVRTTIDGHFRTEAAASQTIAGLEEFLFVPEDLIAREWNDKENEASPHSRISTPASKRDSDGTQVGQVIMARTGSTTRNDKSDRMLSSRSGGAKPDKAGASHDFAPSDVDPDGEGSYLESIPVTFRVVAKANRMRMYHHIIFHSRQATANGEVEIVVGGEQANEVLTIAEANDGKIRGNRITNLPIHEGRNELVVRFGDRLKHAVILNAYERK